MSFILDALKKSEAERQRKDAPGIANIPQSGQGRAGPKWTWIVGALLAVNLVVLFVIVFKPDGGDTATEVTPPVATDTSPAAPETFSQIVRDVRQNPPETVVSNATPSPAPVASQAPAIQTTAPAPRPSVADGLKSFNELRAAGILQLPDMHIDIHVFSATPADRFVFVNMTKYRESATLTEGPVVTEITPDGVVLDYQGIQFLLPRE